MTKDEALIKIATVNAMDYEYQAWAREALAQQAPMNYYRADAEGNLKRTDIHSAQPEQDWIERERAVGYREGHQNALKQMAQPEQKFDTHSVPGKSRNTHSRQPEQEPVAWAKFSAKGNIIDLLNEPDDGYTPLYTKEQL